MKKYFEIVAVDHTIEDGKDGKAPQVIVRLKVVDGEAAGQTKMLYGSLHENAVEYTFAALRNLGWTCDDVSKLTGLGSVKAIAVEDDHEWPKGEWKRRIKYINPIREQKLEAKQPPPAGFATKFKAMAKSITPVEKNSANAAPSKAELDALKPVATNDEGFEKSPF